MSQKNPRRSEAQGVPGKVSEMILEFARPLLDAMGQPGSIEDLRVAMKLVMVCWNLPVLQRKRLPEWDEHQRHFDSVVATSPEPVVPILLGLVESRKTTFGQIPFMVLVEVRGTSLDDCTIYAEARGSGQGQLAKKPT